MICACDVPRARVGPGEYATPGTLNHWLVNNNGYHCLSGDCNNLVLDSINTVSGGRLQFVSEDQKGSIEDIAKGLQQGNNVYIGVLLSARAREYCTDCHACLRVWVCLRVGGVACVLQRTCGTIITSCFCSVGTPRRTSSTSMTPTTRFSCVMDDALHQLCML